MTTNYQFIPNQPIKKMRKLLFLALSGAMILSSCKKVDDPVITIEGEYTFTATINAAATKVSGTSFESGDQIGVSAYSDAALSTVVKQNVLYACSGSKFLSDDAITYTEGTQAAFRAVYPYSSSMGDTFTFAVNTDQSAASAYSESDLLVATTALTSAQEPVLSFDHKLSQIVVTVTESNVSLASATVVVNALTSVDCDLDADTYVGGGSASAIAVASNGTDSYKAIIAPQTVSAGSSLVVVTVAGVDYPIVLDEDTDFESGVSYTYTGTISAEGGFEFTSDITPWEEGGDIVGEEKGDEPEGGITYTELIVGGDFESGASSQVNNNYSSSTGAVSADGEGFNGEGHSYIITNSEVRSNDWEAQFGFILNATLAVGDELKISFDVRTDNGSPITGAGMGITYDPWHVETTTLPDGGSTIYTTTEWQSFSYDITITEANYIAEKLTFSVGNSADNYYLDNVSILLGSAGGSSGGTTDEIVDPQSAGVDFVKNMGVGWNLGNTLDAPGSETEWGNPVTTQAMIDVVADKGFKTLRVPCTWQYHFSDEDSYTIDADRLDRVEEIVNYGLNNDMYVIINIHHDEEIISPTTATLDESKKAVTAIWTQLAERFKDYDDKLIFETLNEMRVEGSANEWSGGTAEERDCLNQLHAAGVAAIRAGAGSYNATRKIMLSTYAASNTSAAMTGLELPEGDENLIVSIHAYSPYDFCMNMEDGADEDWGTDYDKTQLDNTMYAIYEQFVSKGIPVVLGEWGTVVYRDDTERTTHAEYYAQSARDHFMCPVVWDDGGWFQLMDRSGLAWRYPNVVNAIVQAAQ